MVHKGTILANRLKEVLTEGKWVTGTNWWEQIDELPYQNAVSEVKGFNSIYKLSFHIHYYTLGVIDVLEGKPLTISDQYSFDAPVLKSSEDWESFKMSFKNAADKLITLVELMDGTQLAAAFAGGKYGSYERNINVMIEHTYYHLGQLALIKKLIKGDAK